MRIASGSNTRFEHTTKTNASPAAVWKLWTTPSEWRRWDGGLKDARMADSFAVGASGIISPLSGPDARFTVAEVHDRSSCTYDTKLPFARLRVERTLARSRDKVPTTFTHRVSFHGPLGWLWAIVMGRGFRAELPRTMERLASLAEATTKEVRHA